MACGPRSEPRIEITIPELDDAVAALADQVMVVALAAEAVADLTRVVHQRVDDAAIAEQRQRPVDGRQADAVATGRERSVDLLRGRVIPFNGKDAEHGEPLPRRPQAVLAEEGVGLRGRGHVFRIACMRMKIILIMGLAAALAGCGGTSSTHTAGKKRIVAAFYPLAYAAEQVAAPGTEVDNLTPPGVEPHDLEVKPSDVQRIRSADLVLLLGHGFQPALEQAAGTGDRVLRLLDTPGLDRHADNDPHVWLDPVRYALIVKRVALALHRPHAADALLARLRILDGDYRRGLRSCARHDIVTSHEAFAYLSERYGLHQVAITGLSPEAEPTPKRMASIIQKVKQTGATTVFFETLVSPRIADTVAREAGTKTAVLDPIEGLTPDAVKRGADYFTVMRSNLASLRRALGCR